jgi:hypothetical protein
MGSGKVTLPSVQCPDGFGQIGTFDLDAGRHNQPRKSALLCLTAQPLTRRSPRTLPPKEAGNENTPCMLSFLETDALCRLADIRKAKSMLPALRGIYGLFFATPPGLTPTTGCFVRDGFVLLYIGTAGADLRKNGTLRTRLGDHHLGGNERRSTVCQTLAALLPEIAGPAIAKNERGNRKLHTSKDGAMRLRQWMDDNIAACWIDFPRPAELEEKLVRQYAPPLNIDFCTHSFVSTLKALRDKRRGSCV